MLVIDKNYPGLIDCGGYYKIDKIETTESIYNKLNLYVSNEIRSGGHISSDCEISSGGDISSGGHISSGSHIRSDGYILSGGGIRSGGYIRSGGGITVFGDKTEKYFCISGLRYYICVADLKIKIGFNLYTKKEWEEFTDNKIEKMDGEQGLRWWNENKKFILSL